MPEEESLFADVRDENGGFSIPELKWRELIFVGAIRAEGDSFVRDPSRPLPAFARPGLFPAGARLKVVPDGSRVVIRLLAEGRV
jgi:hypothetical protein